MPKAEQEVFYSEVECSPIWVGNHHMQHVARCETPHFFAQDGPEWIPSRKTRHNTTMLVFMQNANVLEQDVFNLGGHSPMWNTSFLARPLNHVRMVRLLASPPCTTQLHNANTPSKTDLGPSRVA